LAAALIVTLHLITPDNTGLYSQKALFSNFVTNIITNTAILFAVVYYAVREIARAEAAAEREFARSETLLANILPPRVAERLKDRPGAEIAERYPEASILFADMAGFTARAADTEPEELVRFLNGVFTRLDALVEKHGLEKIKTTGDAYMVVSGVPDPRWRRWRSRCRRRSRTSSTPRAGRYRCGSASRAARSWPASSARGNSSTTCGATR
jgi:adenylate cyclase